MVWEEDGDLGGVVEHSNVLCWPCVLEEFCGSGGVEGDWWGDERDGGDYVSAEWFLLPVGFLTTCHSRTMVSENVKEKKYGSSGQSSIPITC